MAKKKNDLNVVSEFTGFSVEHNSYTESTSEPDPDDEWSRESTHTTHYVNGLKVSTGKKFDVVGAFVPNESDEKYYLVSVVHSSGDSFGHDDGIHIEFIQVFKTLEKAQACVDQIKLNNNFYEAQSSPYDRKPKDVLKEMEEKLLKDPKDKDYEHTFSVCFKDESDNIQRISAPWNGYFESISSAEIHIFELNKKLKYKI